MARFNFRLQQFLNVKEQIETQRELEYGQAVRKVEEEKQKKRVMEERREGQIGEFRQSLLDSVKPEDIKRYNNTIERLKVQIIEQDKKIAAAQAYAEKKRLALVEAMKERKALESVRESALEDYRKAETIAEQKQVDELVSYVYSQRR